MTTLYLYSTLGCHLCEHALEILKPLISDSGFVLKEIDISESDDLVERYGIRIPVAQRADNNQELGWPFDSVQAQSFLS